MQVPKLNQLSWTAQVSLLGTIVLLVGVFFSVNIALERQQTQSHADTLQIPTPTLIATPTILPSTTP